MPRVIVQTDDGREVSSFEFPTSQVYALYQMPPCRAHTRINAMLSWLHRSLDDARIIQRGGNPERLSERVMRQIHNKGSQ